MNILPKKSWHVWNKDNIARVLRDEAEAAEQERRKRERADQADQEARLETLRRQADGHDTVSTALVPAPVGGVNLFFIEENEARLQATKRPNEEYEAEALAKKRKDEKKLKTYLGEGSVELSDRKPWYIEGTSSSEAATVLASDADQTFTSMMARAKEDRSRRRKERAVQRADPLTDMNKYLSMKSSNSTKGPLALPRPLALPAPPRPLASASTSTANATSSSSNSSSIDRLRQERLQREAEERVRVTEMKARLAGNPVLPSVAGAAAVSREPQRYNQMFNPQYARQGARASGSSSGPSARYSDKYRDLLASSGASSSSQRQRL